jgi:hypothetical protein
MDKKPIRLTRAQIERMKTEICDDATQRATLLFLTALLDENADEDMLVKVLERTSRYAEYIKDHVVRIKEVQRIIERKTGFQFKGF